MKVTAKGAFIGFWAVAGTAVLGVVGATALVKQIVDQHAGRIEIVDRTGPGTCFRVTLPLERKSVRPSPRAQTNGHRDPRPA